MRQTILERVVEERVGQSMVGNVSTAIDRIAEEIAKETLQGGHGYCVPAS